MIKHGPTPVTEVILHTSATPGDWHEGKTVDQMRDEIDRWHRDRGWKGIGYHRVVAPDGSMAEGRSIYKPGAHVKGRNTGTIGICMIPVKTHKGIKEFETYFTEAQRRTVKRYIADLAKLTPISKVTGHNDYAAKECPGFKVRSSSDWLPAPVRHPMPPLPPDVEPTPPKPSGGLLRALLRLLGLAR